MTDEQIAKALECCVEGDTFCYECGEDCPFIDVDMCTVILRRETLDLIKRQQAEIEKLIKVKVFNITVSDTKETMPILFCHEKELKNEAVKEFAERLKEKYIHNTTSITSLVTLYDNIDNLVREMTEKEGGMGC